MGWFGFGFNGFGQIRKVANSDGGERSGENVEVKVVVPVRLAVCDSDQTPRHDSNEGPGVQLRASWSRRATLHRGGHGHLRLSGFGTRGCAWESRACEDALLSETRLVLAVRGRVECWALDEATGAPVWNMEHRTVEEPGLPSALPLVPGGYVSPTPPFFHPLPPQLRVTSLALGLEHGVLLSASGSVFTWGSGSHGQLGHGQLVREDEPRVVEALWGVAMAGVAAGNWHSVCIGAGGDLYTWGWNESGQLGMPAKGLDEERQHTDHGQGTNLQADGDEDSKGVFISIQAFPALVDLPENSEVTKVSCGSRHTAAVTENGDLFTWGWGAYGQLGHGAPCSSDQPLRVDFFFNQGLCILDVVCGPWNTFVCAVEREP